LDDEAVGQFDQALHPQPGGLPFADPGRAHGTLHAGPPDGGPREGVVKNELRKTAIFAGTAVVLVLVAWLTKPSTKAADVFSDQGQEFYPGFKDPTKAASLEVVDYDPLTASYR